MRLSWLVLVFAIISISLADPPSTEAPTSTPSEDTTTPEPGSHEATTTTSGEPINADTDAPTTDDPSAPTEKPATKVTEGPNPGEETDDGITGETKVTEKTTAKVVTTVKTTVKAGSTTTKEPEPDVERFNVHCEKETCTYTMQVPGLDFNTFNDLISKTNQTEEDVNKFENSDLVNLQAGVTKVFDDAQVTVDYIQTQLDEISLEVSNLQTQASLLETAINTLNTAVTNANKNLNKILGNKGSCLYRQCVLKETTTPRPTTVTTTRFVPTPFCNKTENLDICQNGGTCVTWYDSYYCTCPGNLDGQGNDCNTSVCEKINTEQAPGPIVSPGFYVYNSSNTAYEDCDGDGAQWVVKGTTIGKVLGLKETKFVTGEKGNIDHLSANSVLQLSVLKYKLKITSKTKLSQINTILAYDNKATISYSGPAEDFFHFEIVEVDPPLPTP